MSAKTTLIDCGLVVVLAVLVLTLTSLGIAAVIATAVLVLVGLTFVVELVARRGRRRR